MKALVVVAEPAQQRAIVDFFGLRGHSIIACGSSLEAREHLESNAFQFVIVDAAADDRTLDLCRAVRQQPGGERTYVLLALPDVSPTSLRQAMEAGIEDYMQSPIEIVALQLKLALGERSLARSFRRHDLEERVEMAERRYRTLVQTMNEGLFQVDADGRIEFANARMSSFTGYTVDELLGQSADELLVEPEFREKLPGQTLLGSGIGSEEYTLPLKTKEGGRTWVKLVGAPVPTEDGRPGSVGLVQDLTEQRAAEEGLRDQEEYFRALLESSSDLISILDPSGKVLYQSPSSERLLGRHSDRLVGENLFELIHEDDRPAVMEAVRSCLDQQGGLARAQARFRHSSGSWLYLESIFRNQLDNPLLGGITVTSRDISSRRQVEAALKRERAFFQQLFRNSPAGIVILDNADRVVDANNSFVELFQFEVAEIAGRPLSEFIVPDELRSEATELSQAVFHNQSVDRESVRMRKDGTSVDVSILGYPIELADRKIGAYGIYSDITERKAAERELFHEAFHDTLTGLPNRALLTERLERSLRRAARNAEYQFALLFIDLDRFKVINDSLGHAAGDSLLIEMARRLEHCLRPGDTVARLGGDEFNIILEDIKEAADATRVVDRVLESLGEPFGIADQEVVTSGSIGIAFSSTGYDSADDLMRDADIAMYRAKSRGKARYEIFDAEMHRSAVERLQLESELRRALDNEEMELYFQPILSLTTGKLLGFEALCRWNHPTRGLLAPKHWIALCEETGLILPLGRWVLSAACKVLADWQDNFPDHDGASLAVNLSVKEICHPDFLEELDAIAQPTGIRPASLVLEITESLTVEAGATLAETLWELRRRGYRLSIDDFGTGYSSLASLHRFPIDTLKIDRSFIHDMEPGGENLEIVRAIVALGDSLGLQVIAEGVERPDQAEQLRRLGLTYAQGYCFSKPVPVNEAAIFLDRDTNFDC